MPISSKKSLNKLKEEITNCKKCLDLVKTRKQPVPGIGGPSSKIMLVGSSPNEKGSEQSGIPYMDNDSGILIRKILSEAKLSLDEDTYVTYMVKCTPRKTVKKEGQPQVEISKPTTKHINNCINFLTEEISIITPHIIISLGLNVSNTILKNFFSIEKDYKDMNKLHMRIFENPSFKLVPFFNPEDVKNGLISEEKYIEDFKALSKLLSII
jgi:uracil-DNA glycosylase